MSLNDLCNNIGIPEKLKSDKAPEFWWRNYEFLKSAKQKGIYLTYTEPERKNQIAPIDVYIRELRKRTHKKNESKKHAKEVTGILIGASIQDQKVIASG